MNSGGSTIHNAVSIIRAGRVVDTGTLTELRHLTRTTITVQTERDVHTLNGAPGVAAFTLLPDTTGTARLEVEPEHLDRVIRQLAPLGVRYVVVPLRAGPARDGGRWNETAGLNGSPAPAASTRPTSPRC